jgi:hypothetical protein
MEPVPKGLKDSARGFNPGLLIEKEPPQRAAESIAGPAIADTTSNESSSAPSGRGDVLIGTRG